MAPSSGTLTLWRHNCMASRRKMRRQGEAWQRLWILEFQVSLRYCSSQPVDVHPRPLSRTPNLFRVFNSDRWCTSAKTFSTMASTSEDPARLPTEPLSLTAQDSDASRHETTPTDTEMVSDPPTEPQVSTEPRLLSRIFHRAKRIRHPFTTTNSTSPLSLLDHALADLTLTNTIINSFTYFSTSFPIDATAQSSALPTTFNKLSKSVTFRDPLLNNTLSVCPQPEDTFRPWATVEDDEIDTNLPTDHDFGAANRITWTLIQDYLILAEKYRGRSTLAHNARIDKRLPDWILRVSRIPAHMIPTSKREGLFNLVRRQAGDRLHYLEEALAAEANLCDKVAVVHTETMTRLLESEQDKTLSPALHNCTTKMARSRAAAYGKRVYDSVGKRPASNEELDDALIEPLQQNEFKVIARKQQTARSRSPLPGPSLPRSRSPRPRPRPPSHVVRGPTTTGRLRSDLTSSPVNRLHTLTQHDAARPTKTNVLYNSNPSIDARRTRPPPAPHNSRPTSSPAWELSFKNTSKQSWRTVLITTPFPTPPPVTRYTWTLTQILTIFLPLFQESHL